MPKLHIPGPAGLSPLCGRQLNNHRTARAQDSANAAIASTLDQYLAALRTGKPGVCRHCGRVAGLIPKLVRVSQVDLDSEDSGDE